MAKKKKITEYSQTDVAHRQMEAAGMVHGTNRFEEVTNLRVQEGAVYFCETEYHGHSLTNPTEGFIPGHRSIQLGTILQQALDSNPDGYYSVHNFIAEVNGAITVDIGSPDDLKPQEIFAYQPAQLVAGDA